MEDSTNDAQMQHNGESKVSRMDGRRGPGAFSGEEAYGTDKGLAGLAPYSSGVASGLLWLETWAETVPLSVHAGGCSCFETSQFDAEFF